MKKIVKITESDLVKIVRRVISEQDRKNNVDENVFRKAGNKIVDAGKKIAKGLGIDNESLILKKYENKWWKERKSLIGKIIDALAKINYITGTEESDGTAAPDFTFSGNLKEGQPNIVEISITDYETGKDYKIEYNFDTREIVDPNTKKVIVSLKKENPKDEDLEEKDI